MSVSNLIRNGLLSVAASSSSLSSHFPDENEVLVNNELGAIDKELEEVELIMALAEKGIENLSDTALIINAVNPTTTGERKLAAIMCATALEAQGIRDYDLAGLESEEVEAGLEAFNAVKKGMSDLFEWLKKQWVKFRDLLSKYWNQYFGGLAITRRKWTRIKTRAEKYQDGSYSLEDKSKLEFNSGVDNFVLGTAKGKEKDAMSGSDAITDTKNWASIADSWKQDILTVQVPTADDFDGIASFASSVKSTILSFTKLKTTLKVTAGHAREEGDAAPRGNLVYLAGRRFAAITMDVSGSITVTTEDEAKVLLDKVRDCKLEISLTKTDHKALDRISVDKLTVKEVLDLAEANLELCDQLAELKGNKKLSKIETELDKATKSYGKWLKQADSDDQTARSKAKAGSDLAIGLNKLVKNVTLDFAKTLAATARSVSESKAAWASQSLSSYKAA